MILSIASKIQKIADYSKRELSTNSLLKKLNNDPDEDVRKLASTVAFVRSGKALSADEAAITDQVLQIKNHCLTSKEVVTIKDFGAGSSTSTRTEQEMREGVEKTAAIADVCKAASTPHKWGILLFKMIREFQSQNCIELGTCLGVSGGYQLGALKLNGMGNFTTIEGAEALSKKAHEHLAQLDYPHFKTHVGKFTDVLPTVLAKDHPIDFAFIDGHHDKDATMEYFEMIYPFLANKAVLVFDDVNWSPGMQAVWKDLGEDHRMKASFDLYKWGVCLIDKTKTSNEKHIYKLAL